ARGVERRIGRRQRIFDGAFVLDVELDQGAAAAGRPVIAGGVELAARRARIRAGVGFVHFAGLAVVDDDAVARPGTAAEVTVIPAQGAAIGGGELLGLDGQHLAAVAAVD